MSNVHAITPKGEKAALIVLEDATQVWTPDIEKAKAALKIGEPIPSSWTQKQGEYGPQAFPPREGKGGGGFKGRSPEMEQFIQERMDRRTALMQACAVVGANIGTSPIAVADTFQVADAYYTWLRQTSGAAVSASPAVSPVASGPTSGAVKRIPKERVSSSEAEQAGPEETSSGGGGPSAVDGEATSAAASPGATKKGHKPGCDFPGVSEFRKDEVTRMPAGSLRCTGCHITLKESDVA